MGYKEKKDRASMLEYKAHAIKAARQLGYPESVVEKLENEARTIGNIEHIMVNARHEKYNGKEDIYA